MRPAGRVVPGVGSRRSSASRPHHRFVFGSFVFGSFVFGEIVDATVERAVVSVGLPGGVKGSVARSAT